MKHANTMYHDFGSAVADPPAPPSTRHPRLDFPALPPSAGERARQWADGPRARATPSPPRPSGGLVRALVWCVSCLMLAVQAGAQPCTITTPTTIGPNDTMICGNVPLATAEITVRGTTLTMNGRFTIASLSLERNAANQPSTLTHDANFTYLYPDGETVRGLKLTVTGNMLVQGANGFEVGSFVNVTGRGFGGGQGPGAGQNTGGCCTSGGGFGGDGGAGRDLNGGRLGYGASVSGPTEFGSGGGNGNQGSGGNGGGTLRLIVGGSLTVTGTIASNGGSTGNSGAGAGGSIWITASSLAGTGTINANGGNADSNGGGGGGGRVSLEYSASTFTGTAQAIGGGGREKGGAGTVYSRLGNGTPSVLLDNAGDGERSKFPGDAFTGDIIIRNGARLGPTYGQVGWHFQLNGNMTIDSGGRLDADGRGFPGGEGPGAGFNTGGCCTSGAGFGGDGGVGRDQSGGRLGYGNSVSEPVELGSGGGNGNQGSGGRGGGALRITASGSLTVNTGGP